MTTDGSRSLVDKLFRIGVALKGVDGLLEVTSGLALLVFPVARLQAWVATIAQYEIGEDKHALIATFILHLDNKINPHIQLFAVIYLLAHGSIKLFLVVALLKQRYRLYPYAIAFLVIFIVYQAYLISINRSITLALLTLFDCSIATLTYIEWRRHRSGNSLPAK
jgi:uncharacterized membrane protein